jgi:PRTRC genetic system ThiF family protein
VKLYFVDPDHVESANVLRQCFCDAEIGLNKAKTLALRYSLAWKIEVTAIAQPFQPEWIVPSYNTLIVVTACVDNAKARESITQVLQHNTHRTAPNIWHLDCGNSKRSGQVLFGSHLSTNPNDYHFEALGCFRLPAPTIQQPDLLVSQPEELADNNLSCEQMALLNSQSLSINQRVAAEAFDYLLQLTTGKLRRFATYFDLESGSGKSLYTTQVSIMQAILLGRSCA